ncbi:4-diphosphocytidyl-2-C-methyl-D-erythritol kinase [Hespellia stercorisuis DSM 15480]|uniref:4-diphosphocytidyl-2-C-methyl-D-erythritol kinase n=2 Tax=Hespellia stercorisuis TaxID=180311 RepID=A0A1M6QLU8_9FIRM|nr:4-(cytidine 5'-diphospho)-2-C-methyl-D-erythritol kinase [Hespellia stercorisuis]SHK21043.1 4-diphosphocytidyl-2-C-methyl-D-erythritol kinase [Hespellia stercorisuis DSM 15480]
MWNKSAQYVKKEHTACKQECEACKKEHTAYEKSTQTGNVRQIQSETSENERMNAMRQLELKALAKINLGLDVLGRRENGYHDVRMIMQSIYLYDNVTIAMREEPGIEVKTNLEFLPVDESNIAYKAAKLLTDEFGIKKGVTVTLEKHIPVAAGLAGGSSNAAAVLFGMNRMFSLKLSQQDLMDRGVKLGADVPYCIMRGTVLAEGIGEELSLLPDMPKCIVLIAKPPISVSTKGVYEALDAKTIVDHPDIDGIISGLETRSIEQIAGSMGNVLEQVTIGRYPVITEIKDAMKECGALNAMMSGSGPTVFGIFKDRRSAKNAQNLIRDRKLARQVYVTNVHNARRK